MFRIEQPMPAPTRLRTISVVEASATKGAATP
jgi:hypothetical protein